MQNLAETPYSASFAAADQSTVLDTIYAKAINAAVTCAVASSSAKTFLDANVGVVANTITITAHGFATGRKVAATSGGTLPAGLTATNYWVIAVDVDTIQLATSAAAALLGTAVDITAAAGGGTHTLTPAALSGASIKWQWSPDNTNWFDISGQTQNITTDGVLAFAFDTPAYTYLKAVLAITAGQVLVTVATQTVKHRSGS